MRDVSYTPSELPKADAMEEIDKIPANSLTSSQIAQVANPPPSTSQPVDNSGCKDISLPSKPSKDSSPLHAKGNLKIHKLKKAQSKEGISATNLNGGINLNKGQKDLEDCYEHSQNEVSHHLLQRPGITCLKP